MIAYIEGVIINKSKNYLIINIGGLGYKVFVGSGVFVESQIGETIKLYTFHQISEQATALYGMKSINELELFELLLSVSGVGPKTAITAFNAPDISDIIEPIMIGDAKLLSQTTGLGKKTAERVVLELANKISNLGITFKKENLENPDYNSLEEMEALVALGYSANQARLALKEVGPSIKDSSERIKQALRKIK